MEASKAFSKDFMHRHSIPTARYRTFDSSQFNEACDYVRNCGFKTVLKADGLAGGNDEEVERWIMRPAGTQPSERRLGIERDDVLGTGHWAGVGGHNAPPHKFSSTRDVLRGGGVSSQMHECADRLSRERSFQVPTPR